MGMYDKETQLKNAEVSKGEFVLWAGDFLGLSKSAEYGENQKARVTVSSLNNLDADARKQYVVYGVLAEQVARMESGDVPAVVRLGKDGRANIFELVRPLDDNPL